MSLTLSAKEKRICLKVGTTWIVVAGLVVIAIACRTYFFPERTHLYIGADEPIEIVRDARLAGLLLWTVFSFPGLLLLLIGRFLGKGAES